jgi:hypothetical protein
MIGLQPFGMFVSKNNSIYVADNANHNIRIWLDAHVNSTFTVRGNLSSPHSIFVRDTGEMYVDNGGMNFRVDKHVIDSNASDIVMYVGKPCISIFITLDDLLYCSIKEQHQVVSKSLSIKSNLLAIVAGTGCFGSTANMLNGPHGIFVDDNLDLYVADCGNNRVQLFQVGRSNATTLAAAGSVNVTISLNCPRGVVLDVDKYLFIVDGGNHRIVASGPHGFRCLVSCNGVGSTSDALNNPTTMAFDSYGNIFVVDRGNSRIQKFELSVKLSGE